MQRSSHRVKFQKHFLALSLLTAAILWSISLHTHAQDNVNDQVVQPAEPPSSPAASAAFISAAKRNLARLDRDRDGILTLNELEIALQDHHYVDEDAAAVAALFWGAQAAKASHVLGSYRISGPNNDFDNPQLARADGGVAVEKIGNRYYRAGLNKIRKANRVVFASPVPQLTAIRQTWASDCYFNSAVGSVAHFTPERIVRMIQKEGNSYRVTFPNKAPQLVPEPTDAELAAFTNASDGIWFNLLEKAYSPHKRIRPVTPDADPLDAVAVHGGHGGDVLKVLTGHDIKRMPLPTKSGKSATPQLYNEVRQTILAAQRDNRAMVAGMHKHTYAVVSLDAASNQVRIHNPYDNAGTERLSGGQQVQRDTEGFFTVSLNQFVDSFNGLIVERPK